MVVRRWSALVLVVVLAVAARSCATIGTDDDGANMVGALVMSDTWIAPWYHSAYLAIASVLTAPFGYGSEFEALLWASALASAAAVGALVFVFPAGDSRTWPVAAAIVCSPGWWTNATRVELHGVQLLGGVVVLLGALRLQRSAVVTRREIALFALAVGAAILCHRTNLFVLPGAVWLAARGRSRRVWFETVTAAAVLFVVATLINARGETVGAALLQERSLVVLQHFWTGLDPAFVWSEFVCLWFPALCAPFLVPPRSWRAVLPALVCAAPGVVFFACFGVETLGGYFGASLVFLVALTACDGSAPERFAWRSARGVLAALVFAAGLAVSHGQVHSPERALRDTVVEQRLAAAALTLPRGGAYFGVEATEQSLDGRRRGLIDADLYLQLVVMRRKGLEPTAAARHVVASIETEHTSGNDVAFDLGWHAWGSARPLVEPYLAAVEEFLRARPDVREVATPIGVHLVWPVEPTHD